MNEGDVLHGSVIIYLITKFGGNYYKREVMSTFVGLIIVRVWYNDQSLTRPEAFLSIPSDLNFYLIVK